MDEIEDTSIWGLMNTMDFGQLTG